MIVYFDCLNLSIFLFFISTNQSLFFDQINQFIDIKYEFEKLKMILEKSKIYRILNLNILPNLRIGSFLKTITLPLKINRYYSLE